MTAEPDSSDWDHQTIAANGVDIHVVRAGRQDAEPLVLLHGWPEFWYVWHKVIPSLAQRFHVVAPDLRGFGDTTKPERVPRIQDYVGDLAGLLDGLGLDRAGLVAHDVGAYVAQGFALAAPDRVSGLFFFNCPYPGIGKRWAEADHLNEIWYQSFHQLDVAPKLVGSSREACRLYFQHFLSHWAADPNAFDADLEAWVDNFMKPGNLEGGFAWYKSVNDARLAQIRNGPPRRPKIAPKSYFLWGAKDPIVRADWSDAVGDYFEDPTVEIVPDAGHYVHYEMPELAVERIATFFAGSTL